MDQPDKRLATLICREGVDSAEVNQAAIGLLLSCSIPCKSPALWLEAPVWTGGIFALNAEWRTLHHESVQ